MNQQPFAYWPNALTSGIPAVSVERGQCRAEAMHTSQVPILSRCLSGSSVCLFGCGVWVRCAKHDTVLLRFSMSYGTPEGLSFPVFPCRWKIGVCVSVWLADWQAGRCFHRKMGCTNSLLTPRHETDLCSPGLSTRQSTTVSFSKHTDVPGPW